MDRARGKGGDERRMRRTCKLIVFNQRTKDKDLLTLVHRQMVLECSLFDVRRH